MKAKFILSMLLLVFGNASAYADEDVFSDGELVYLVQSPITKDTSIDVFLVDNAAFEQLVDELTQENQIKGETLQRELSEIDKEKNPELYLQKLGEGFGLQQELMGKIYKKAHFVMTVKAGETNPITLSRKFSGLETENLKVSAQMITDSSVTPSVARTQLKVESAKTGRPVSIVELDSYAGKRIFEVLELQPRKLIRIKENR